VRRALSIGREPALTAAILEEVLPGCSVLEPITRQSGPRRVQLKHDRPSPEQAIEDIAAVALRLGFFVGSAVINEWAGDVGERAARWLLGDGAVDAPATNPVDGILVDIIGTVSGRWSATRSGDSRPSTKRESSTTAGRS